MRKNKNHTLTAKLGFFTLPGLFHTLKGTFGLIQMNKDLDKIYDKAKVKAIAKIKAKTRKRNRP